MLKNILSCVVAIVVLPAAALDGEIAVHDPSTVISEAGHYYTYGTGNGLPVLTSDDGWTWKRAGSLMSAVPGGKAVVQPKLEIGDDFWTKTSDEARARLLIEGLVRASKDATAAKANAYAQFAFDRSKTPERL